MALDQNNARLLLWLHANGIPLGNVLTIGRLGVFLSPEILQSDAKRFGFSCTGIPWKDLADSAFCEPLLLALGAKTVESLDASAYEGASIIQDLNLPIPPELRGRCDLLFDSGSLEHVFNVPQALKNYVQLVRPGGWIALDLPCDGRCGHGFYQFSPDLFYQFFEPASGAKLEAMFCVRDEPQSDWFVIPPPAEVQGRIELYDKSPLHLFIVARRLEDNQRGTDNVNPAQSDYERAWKQSSEPTTETPVATHKSNILVNSARAMLRTWMPERYWKWSALRNERKRIKPWFVGKSKYFQRVNPFAWRLLRRAD